MQDINHLFVLSDPSIRGIKTAGRISRLLKDLKTRVRDQYLVLNRVRHSLSEPVTKAIENEGLRLICSIPEDKDLLALDQKGNPIWHYISHSSAYPAVEQLMNKLDILHTGLEV